MTYNSSYLCQVQPITIVLIWGVPESPLIAFGPCDFVRENSRKNYEELLRSLSANQKSSQLELWDLPLRWLIRGQTFGLVQSSSAY